MLPAVEWATIIEYGISRSYVPNIHLRDKNVKNAENCWKKSIIKHCVDLCLSRPIYRNVLVGALLRSYLVLSVYIHDSSIYKKL